MDEEKRKREKLRRQDHERLRTTKTACSICGETIPACFDDHHEDQRRYGPSKVRRCKNCHAILTSLQRLHPKPIWDPPHELERIAHALYNEADECEVKAMRKRRQADTLMEYVRKECPFEDENTSPDGNER